MMDELSVIEEREKVRNAAIEARRAKIAKRGQIGTRLAETFQVNSASKRLKGPLSSLPLYP
jgi:hypothetical protein